MTMKCKKCQSENVEFREYEYSSQHVWLDLICDDCGNRFDLSFTNFDFRSYLNSGCVRCSSSNCDSSEWDSDLNEDGNILMTVVFNCDDCGLHFEREYLED
ncbi:hypothetical protein PQE20_17600 [Vibrio harveyi]|uniref:hypothetical protein n=1 Tax=Vibrio harveyi TaxID=669 RepID=UPI00234C3583|nr:hypothetical protein [Vibrio harveyi]WCP83233.1 hypothetical protein PQE20_17600 [Vibrio harveyi]